MMRSFLNALCAILSLRSLGAGSLPTQQIPIAFREDLNAFNRTVSNDLFYELEELSRIVDISYCVGTTGIQKPFLCASRCQEFEGFELVKTWNTGPLLADSCGYIVISHPPSPPRIILAFRGTYSVANTIIDLSTIPQEYIPYPGDGNTANSEGTLLDSVLHPLRHSRRAINPEIGECTDCTVHAGFMKSWRHTRHEILLDVERVIEQYPDYQLTLVGHSLGGAVAALASLDFKARGWNPKVTTFGEPRIGNQALMEYLEKAFPSEDDTEPKAMYRRVTHVDDPVPLLPLKEWGFRMHSGEIFISKPSLSPAVGDLQHCKGGEDPNCIAGADPPTKAMANEETESWMEYANMTELWNDGNTLLAIPARFKIWQIFFAHRDYFWRLGLCIPGGDPLDWYREYPHIGNDELR